MAVPVLPAILAPMRRAMALLASSVLVVACATGGSVSSSSLAPTPTPVAAPVVSPEDAAARVIGSDPRFAGATQLRPDAIGLSKWWEARSLQSGAYEIKLTVGSGDCQAGCIDRHQWTFNVAADGTLKLVSESGDPLPSNP
jgi:hypothetical protein